MAKKQKQPFDNRKGLLMLPISMILSDNYQTLYPYAKQLMLHMQIHWRGDKPVAFGVREAMSVLRCNKRTAIKAFKELQSRGFIIKVGESVFNSRAGSKARVWHLTWLPFNYLEPTKEWEKWTDEN